MKFKIKARRPDGSTVQLFEEHPDQKNGEDSIFQRNYFLISITPVRKNKKAINAEVFFTELSDLLNAGHTIEMSLRLMAKYSKNAETINSLIESIRKGQPFSSILRENGIADSGQYALLLTGEESGEFSEAINLLSRNVKEMARLKRKIRALLFYPVFLITLMTVVFSYIFIFVLPKITAVFADLGVELPSYTITLIALITKVRNNPILSVFSTIVLVRLVFYLVRRNKNKILYTLIRVPVFGNTIKRHYLFKLLHPLSLMVRKGVYFPRIIEFLTDSFGKNTLLGDLSGRLRTALDTGASLPAALASSSLFPDRYRELLSVSVESSRFSETLEHLAQDNAQAYEESLKTIVSLLEPLIIILIGCLILAFVVSFILPMINIDTAF